MPFRRTDWLRTGTPAPRTLRTPALTSSVSSRGWFAWITIHREENSPRRWARSVRHPGRKNHRHAGADPDDVRRIDLFQPHDHLLEVPVREHQRIPSRKKDLLHLGSAGEEPAGIAELCLRDAPAAVAGEMPPEAEPAVRGASIAHQEKRPVTVVTDETLGHQVPRVTDGVRRLVRKGDELPLGGDVLGRDGIDEGIFGS